MAIETVPTLIEALRDGRLLNDEQLRQIEAMAPERFPQPRDLATDLVERGWLTRFQAKQVMRGHGSELTLGVYRLLELLGEGGMGHVYKALHQPMNRIVALKVVKPELVADPRTLKRFRREAQLAGRLAHPHIVTVFDANQVGNIHFLAMEYIDGIDLTALVRNGGPLAVAAACDYIRQAAMGLNHAHEHRMIHRDVKPSNLLVTRSPPQGIVKILDLGLARPARIEGAGSQNVSALTIDGSVVGTPDFMAPEQAKNSQAVDHRADLYSLGCTFYYILTGRLPFPDGNIMDKLIKHQLEDPYPVEMIRNDVSPEVLAVLRKMTAKKPEDRHQSGAEAAAALEPFCAATTCVPTVATAAEPSDMSPVPEVAGPSVSTKSFVPEGVGAAAFRFEDSDAPPARKNRTGVYLIVACSIVAIAVMAIGLFVALW